MYKLLFKQCLRSRMYIISILLIFVMGCLSIWTGKQFLLNEEKEISQVHRQQEDHIERNATYHPDDLGLFLYYVRFALIDKISNLTALSRGQSDVNSNIQRVTIRNLEGQRYDTDLNNPIHQLIGNLDLSFIIINLFPLLIIVFTYNLLSNEIESGTWRLVSVQTSSKLKVLLSKILVRMVLIVGVSVVLFLVAGLILPLTLDRSFLIFILLSILYLFFWFSLSFWIISFKRSSSFNAIVSLSIWLILVMVAPAGLNNFLSIKYPVPEALETMIKQRDGYHTKWDMDKDVTMEKFFDHYPQFAKYEVPQDEFSWLWYYGMQQMGDDESLKERKAMREKIVKREEVSRKISWLIPSLHSQLTFNDLAESGLKDHLQFQDSTEVFHEKLRLQFYPQIFEGKPVMDIDWVNYTPTFISHKNNASINSLLPILILTTMMVVLGWVTWKND